MIFIFHSVDEIYKTNGLPSKSFCFFTNWVSIPVQLERKNCESDPYTLLFEDRNLVGKYKKETNRPAETSANVCS